ncbi:DUF3168 domain-containing protein [Kaistia algarum]|uniref:DUF3168 domain-containing protein n=1 Tax=Kaistia algarum TaxID=2083279 RepID=UPI000CE917C0|nr:DUF3168 domain-containing protein [Kaistia algarum]MCX5512124.1 DUF3168 domain-containing protein [Kaistia algarum]PPE80234.1 DUF3168 domain-containing protein [Kaistia algarum]
MNPAALDLQAAIAAALLVDADLVALLGGPRIHDGAPRGTEFPFLTIGDGAQSDWSDGDTPGGQVRVTLHVWSRAAGKREAWTILGRLMSLLHEAELTLADHALVLLRAEFAEVRTDPDGLTEHGVLRLGALVEG